MARTYLSSLYPERPSDRLPGEGVKGVYVIPGRMTAMLRRLWGLNELLTDHNYVENPHSGAPKNRLDHRHHAIDAARSEERRAGKECVSKCRSRWSPTH